MTPNLDNQLVSHQLFVDTSHWHAIFARLRREDPVHRIEADGYPPFWAVTKHADIVEVERRSDLFLNAPLTFMRSKQEMAVRMKETGGTGQYLRMLVHMDGPDHRMHRAIAQTWFMPPNLKRLEEMVNRVAAEMVDRLLQHSDLCDFAQEIAQWYPLRVIMTLLGIPEQDHEMLLHQTQHLLAPADPELRRSHEDQAEGASLMKKIMGEYLGYFGKVAQDRRVNPKDDLATLLTQAQPDGKPIGQMELLSYFVILATAGHDTTASSLGGGLLALLEHPDQFARLRAEPQLLPTAVDEMFRWTTPVKHFCRTASADAELRGRKIAKGDHLALFYPSANMDEEVFDAPERFRIDRSPNRHLAFGFGPHVCLGQHLSRLELKAFFTELTRRVSRIELAGQPEPVVSNEVAGMKHLPLRCVPA